MRSNKDKAFNSFQSHTLALRVSRIDSVYVNVKLVPQSAYLREVLVCVGGVNMVMLCSLQSMVFANEPSRRLQEVYRDLEVVFAISVHSARSFACYFSSSLVLALNLQEQLAHALTLSLKYNTVVVVLV